MTNTAPGWNATCDRGWIDRVLEDVAEGVVHRTPFQRALATCYETPLIPGADEPKSGLLGSASRGVCERDLEALLEHLADGGRVSGARYQETFRVGGCYFYPEGGELALLSPNLPSTRRFLGMAKWRANDVLLVPFQLEDGRVLGHVSVDDPRDGARPSARTLRLLEEVASIATLAIRDACALEELSETHQLFRFLTESGMIGALVVVDERIRYANDHALGLLGYARDELYVLRPWWHLLHPDDRPFAWRSAEERRFLSETVRAVRRDGRTVWLSTCVHPMSYRGAPGIAVQFYDVTERVETEERLKERALRDPLTGFRNRSYFEDAIQLEITRSSRYRRPLTLVMADLARFKRVNDTLGHQAGDRILAGVADVIRSQLRESDWVVRYGGDEFLLVLPETGPDLMTLISRLQKAIVTWCEENVEGVSVGIDFGAATWRPDAPVSVADLLREADAALYEEKARRTEKERGRTRAGEEPHRASDLTD